jgi:hypothetical protein
MRQEMATNDESLRSGKGVGAVLLEKRRRKKAMFVSRKPTTQVVQAELKGIEEFTAQSNLDIELSGVCICPHSEPKGAICATRFMSGRCMTFEGELQKLRQQDKLRITCQSP